MKESQIEDFVKIIETGNIHNANFINWTKSHKNYQNTSMPIISTMLKSVTVKIDKDYNENLIIVEFIEKIVNFSEPNTYNKGLYEHETIGQINSNKDIRRLVSRMLSCSNYIAVNGKIGPAHFILMSYYYYEKLQNYPGLITDGKICNIPIIPTHLLEDNMIFGRKNNENQAGVFLFLDKSRNKYNLKVVGDAQHQYHILKISNLQTERKKKIIEIENKKQICK